MDNPEREAAKILYRGLNKLAKVVDEIDIRQESAGFFVMNDVDLALIDSGLFTREELHDLGK